MTRIWRKAPTDIEAYTITWRGSNPNVEYALEDAETIATSSWTLEAGITEDSSSNDTTTTTIFIAGGTEGTRYKVTNTVTTSAGRTLARSVYVHVLELWVD